MPSSFYKYKRGVTTIDILWTPPCHALDFCSAGINGPSTVTSGYTQKNDWWALPWWNSMVRKVWHCLIRQTQFDSFSTFLLQCHCNFSPTFYCELQSSNAGKLYSIRYLKCMDQWLMFFKCLKLSGDSVDVGGKKWGWMSERAAPSQSSIHFIHSIHRQSIPLILSAWGLHSLKQRPLVLEKANSKVHIRSIR